MRVLLVEDEPSLVRVISSGLEAEGIDVEIERDGPSGLWRATEASHDVIVLDIMLPGMNGFQVCAEIRSRGIWTPVLMLTAKSGEYDEAEALDTGADDYLRKPFSFVVLLARLRSLARRQLPKRPSVIEVGSLRVDPAKQEVDIAGRDVNLTRREFGVLEMLLRADGQPVSTRRLLDHVWGFDAEVDSNVVQVNVATLRRKLDSERGAPRIETIRGVGYVVRRDAT